MEYKLNKIITQIINESGRQVKIELNPRVRFREDLNFDSLALATLTVMIEDEFHKDIFENGNVYTISDVLKILESN